MSSGHSHHLSFIVGGSILANIALWYGLSRGADQVVTPPPPPELVFDRVVVEKQDIAHPKKLVFHPVLPQKPAEHRRVVDKPPPPPQGAHNKVETQKSAAKSPDSFTALADGKAKLGSVVVQQPGSGQVTPPTPPPPVVTPPSRPPPVVAPPGPPQPPVVTPPPSLPPAPVKHEDPPPPPAPPKPKGETREAVPGHQVSVEIPDNLKNQTFKSFVRVKVQIAADGTFQVVLRTSSGNTDIDKLVLDALNKWTWKAALKDGDPVDSVQLFRFNFSVE